MFRQSLIESTRHRGPNGSLGPALLSIAVHGIVIGAIAVIGFMTHEAVQADEPITAYLVNSPPPPPPPPPPPASSGPTTPRVVEEPDPIQIPEDNFVVPDQIPEEVPEVEPLEPVDTETPGGVVGGVEGGVEGGVIGGVVGGVIGGVIGGQLGGVLGGTGTGPYRPGPEVTAPRALYKIEPTYTEDARKARVQGIVILDAVIDEKGNVTQVQVLKPLSGGLSEKAIEAIRQWKYEPGRKDGKPVPVIITVSISFRLQ